MKKTWILPCVVLLAAARFAYCDDNSSGTKSDQSTTAKSTTVSTAAPVADIAAVNTLPAWVKSTAQSYPQRTAGVPNFGKLNDHIWRSGQPSRQGYRLLASRGLKTVVNLREEFPQDKELIPPGVHYIYIPVKDEHAPTQEQAQEFIKAAADPANWPLLVHCHAGEGRAGTMAALVRCSLDNWEDSAVMKETNGFISARFMGLIKPQLESGQRQLIRRWEAEAGAIQATARLAAGAAPVVNGSAVATSPGH